MNINVVLGQGTQVPNLMIIFGTVPNLLFYADYVARSDVKVDEEYVKKYYEGEANQDYLDFHFAGGIEKYKTGDAQAAAKIQQTVYL